MQSVRTEKAEYQCINKIVFQEILTVLWLDYRDASLMILNLVVIGITVPKVRWIGLIYHIKNVVKKVRKTTCFKWTYRLSGNDFKVAKPSK